MYWSIFHTVSVKNQPLAATHRESFGIIGLKEGKIDHVSFFLLANMAVGQCHSGKKETKKCCIQKYFEEVLPPLRKHHRFRVFWALLLLTFTFSISCQSGRNATARRKHHSPLEQCSLAFHKMYGWSHPPQCSPCTYRSLQS